jgi:hypothetical protein
VHKTVSTILNSSLVSFNSSFIASKIRSLMWIASRDFSSFSLSYFVPMILFSSYSMNLLASTCFVYKFSISCVQIYFILSISWECVNLRASSSPLCIHLAMWAFILNYVFNCSL